MRLLILIAQTVQQPWRDIAVRGQMETWRKSIQARGIETLDLFARPAPPWYQKFEGVTYRIVSRGRPSQVVGQSLLLAIQFVDRRSPRTSEMEDAALGPGAKLQANTVDDYLFHGRSRVLAGLEASMEFEWDVLFMTTASSYLNLGALTDALRSAVANSGYGGRLVTYRNPTVPWAKRVVFASGSCCYLTRETVATLLPQLPRMSRSVHPDVGVGRLCAVLGLQPTALSSVDVSTLGDIERLSEEELALTTHFRLKSGTWGKRDDVALMHALHARVTELEVQ